MCVDGGPGYSHPVDWWSLGVTAYELLRGWVRRASARGPRRREALRSHRAGVELTCHSAGTVQGGGKEPCVRGEPWVSALRSLSISKLLVQPLGCLEAKVTCQGQQLICQLKTQEANGPGSPECRSRGAHSTVHLPRVPRGVIHGCATFLSVCSHLPESPAQCPGAFSTCFPVISFQ